MSAHNARKVINLDTGRIFGSVSSAAEIYNIHRSMITYAIGDKSRTAANCHWDYVDPVLKKKQKEIVSKRKPKKDNRRKIRNVETNEIFPSIKDAADKYFCNPQLIYRALKNKNKTSMGYHWVYVDD